MISAEGISASVHCQNSSAFELSCITVPLDLWRIFLIIFYLVNAMISKS